MPQEEQVRSYQRHSASGQLITVQAHTRTNADVSAEARKLPGRPPMAAQGGQFANGRSLPNVWVSPAQQPTVTLPDGSKVPDPGVSDLAKTHARGLATKLAGVPGADKAVAALHKLTGDTPAKPQATAQPKLLGDPKAPLKISPRTFKVVGQTAAKAPAQPRVLGDPKAPLQISPSTFKVIGLAKSLANDPDVVGLADGSVHVRSYKRHDAAGRLVDVEAYTQLRELISALGGPHMAAHKGLVASLFKDLIPDHGSAFTGHDSPSTPHAPQAEPNLLPTITKDQFSNPDTPRTRPVTAREFQTLALRGKTRMDQLVQHKSSPGALRGQQWESLKERAYAAVQSEWGGVTTDSHTGIDVNDNGSDQFAMTVKPLGMDSVSVPISATREQFDAAMESARTKFADQLAMQQGHLGVFRDEDSNRIDIDPVLMVDNLDDVETIGSYTRNVGGAYNFRDGNGYWPPYVLSGAPTHGDRPQADTGSGQAGLPQGSGSVASAGGGGPGAGAAGKPGSSGGAAQAQVALAAGAVHVGSYKRHNAAGKLVDVQSYTQRRDLASPSLTLPKGLSFTGEVPEHTRAAVVNAIKRIKDSTGIEVGNLIVKQADDDPEALAYAASGRFYVTPPLSDDAFMKHYGMEWDGGLSLAGGKDKTPAQVREDVIIHEIGHVLQSRAEAKGGRERIADLVNEPITPRSLGYIAAAGGSHKLDEPRPRWQIDHLSNKSAYANESRWEYFAESFTDGVLNGDKAEPTSKKVLEILRDELSAAPQPGATRPAEGSAAGQAAHAADGAAQAAEGSTQAVTTDPAAVSRFVAALRADSSRETWNALQVMLDLPGIPEQTKESARVALDQVENENAAPQRSAKTPAADLPGGGEYVTLFHGTTAAHAASIAKTGLRENSNVPTASWYQVTTSKEQAHSYAGPDGAVVEFRVPKSAIFNRLSEDRASATLWPGAGHNVYGQQATAYAVKGTLPASYVTKVHAPEQSIAPVPPTPTDWKPKMLSARIWPAEDARPSEIQGVDMRDFRDSYLPSIFGEPSLVTSAAHQVFNPVQHGGQKKTGDHIEGPAVFQNYATSGMPRANLGTEPIKHVYRAMSAAEWAQAERDGFIGSDQRGVIADWEGTNAGANPATAMSYLPRNGDAVIVQIAVKPEDKWFTTDVDDYLRTREKVPLDRITARTGMITSREGQITDVGELAPRQRMPTPAKKQ